MMELEIHSTKRRDQSKDILKCCVWHYFLSRIVTTFLIVKIFLLFNIGMLELGGF